MYSKKKIQEIANEMQRKVSAKTATAEDTLLGLAAANTVDFLSIAEDNKIPLSLTNLTEENVPKVMVFLHKYNLERNLSVSESRKDIAKKVGGYELFSLLNGLEASGVKVEINAILDRLYIKHQNPDGEIIRFDVFGEIEKTLDSFKLSSSKKDSFILMGTLQPFYRKLVEGFLKQIQ